MGFLRVSLYLSRTFHQPGCTVNPCGHFFMHVDFSLLFFLFLLLFLFFSAQIHETAYQRAVQELAAVKKESAEFKVIIQLQDVEGTSEG